MANGVTIYGGFANSGNSTFLLRNATINSTILSGNIGIAGNTDNSYHVISNPSGLGNTAVMDGFIIEDGNANNLGSFQNLGGGIINNITGNPGTCSPQIVNCTFRNNTATLYGGAVYNNALGRTTSPLFINCVFQNNSAVNVGVVYNDVDAGGTCNPVFRNSTFSGNSAPSGNGSVMYSNSPAGTCSTAVTNSIFYGNGGNKTFFNVNAIVQASYNMFEPLVNNYTNLIGNLSSSASPFVGPGYFHLKDQSTAIDGGTASGAPLQDIEAVVRTAIPDMGAFENKQSCIGVNKIYYSDSSGSAYQWQIFNGTDFVNISNGAAYANVSTNKLTVITPANTTTGTRLRCSVTTPGGTVNSS